MSTDLVLFVEAQSLGPCMSTDLVSMILFLIYIVMIVFWVAYCLYLNLCCFLLHLSVSLSHGCQLSDIYEALTMMIPARY